MHLKASKLELIDFSMGNLVTFFIFLIDYFIYL